MHALGPLNDRQILMKSARTLQSSRATIEKIPTNYIQLLQLTKIEVWPQARHKHTEVQSVLKLNTYTELENLFAGLIFHLPNPAAHKNSLAAFHYSIFIKIPTRHSEVVVATCDSFPAFSGCCYARDSCLLK